MHLKKDKYFIYGDIRIATSFYLILTQSKYI